MLAVKQFFSLGCCVAVLNILQLRDSFRKIGQKQESTEDKMAALEAELAMVQASLDEAQDAKGEAVTNLDNLTFRISEMERDLAQVNKMEGMKKYCICTYS